MDTRKLIIFQKFFKSNEIWLNKSDLFNDSNKVHSMGDKSINYSFSPVKRACFLDIDILFLSFSQERIHHIQFEESTNNNLCYQYLSCMNVHCAFASSIFGFDIFDGIFLFSYYGKDFYN